MNGTTLTQASKQWSSRPSDERFLNLISMSGHFHHVREHSKASVITTKRINTIPNDDNEGLSLQINNDEPANFTHWSFGQVSQLAGAPAGYLRSLPAPLSADCINFGLQFKRDIEEVGVLTYRNGDDPVLRAATGPKYGRIWNTQIVDALIKEFGDGINGQFRVPGEFGKEVDVTKENTTLYASDRDMFVFLADEKNRIEIPNRRNGQSGLLARGFFVWNSEVGSATFGIATFLFDYVCCNRMVWGAQEFREIKMRHTAGAPDRFIHDVTPALRSYTESSTSNIVQAIEDAKNSRLDDVDEWLKKRYSRRMAETLQTVHKLEENRPIETRWDVATALTAQARSIPYQDQRVAMEREAGKLLAA